MGNIMILAILIVLVVLAAFSSRKHFKGECGCCGGCVNAKEIKKLTGPKQGEKSIQIEGMHCDNCKNRIERALNRIDGVVGKVKLRKKVAKVIYSREVEDELLKKTVEDLGYEVKGIF